MIAHPLDQPLPAELTGRGFGWFTQYRRFPVFGPPWIRGRTRIVGLSFGLFLLLVLPPVYFVEDAADRPWPGLAALLVEIGLPAIVGPLLGLWVRRRGWPAARERAALWAAVLATTALVSVFYAWGEEPLKDAVARMAGTIGPDGKRNRVTMSIGVAVRSERDNAASGAAPTPPSSVAPSREEPIVFVVNLVARAGLAFLLAGGLALRGWRRETDGLAALERERALAAAQAARREAELRLSVLAAQVEPHFLFNTLAGVRSAIATDPARASEMIDRLVDYLRASIPRLRGDQAAQATVGAQFDIVRAYLSLMASRMPRLGFDLQAPAELLGARFPPLMLISLAENAVKHGVEMKIGPAKVTLRAERTGDGRLALTVEDDGVGFGAAPAAGSGLGLTNIRERLAQLYGDAASLVLKARAEGGVAATITVPLETTA